MTVEISIICWLNVELRGNEPCRLSKLRLFLRIAKNVLYFLIPLFVYYTAVHTYKYIFQTFILLNMQP